MTNYFSIDCQPITNHSLIDCQPITNHSLIDCQPITNHSLIDCQPITNHSPIDCQPITNHSLIDCQPITNQSQTGYQNSHTHLQKRQYAPMVTKWFATECGQLPALEEGPLCIKHQSKQIDIAQKPATGFMADRSGDLSSPWESCGTLR